MNASTVSSAAPPLPSYRTLLQELASLNALQADTLLQSEELAIGDMRIGLHCDGDEHDGDLLLYVSLGETAPEYAARIDQRLLEANHLGIATGGCTLGRHPTSGVVTLSVRMPISLTQADALSALLRSFHAHAVLWRSEIAPGAQESEPSSE